MSKQERSITAYLQARQIEIPIDSKINCSTAVTVLLVQRDLGRCEQKRGDV